MIRTVVAAAVATCVLALAACDGSDRDQGLPSPSPTSSESSTTTPTTPSSSPRVPVYLQQFSAQERRAYGQAKADYDAFGKRNAALYRVGKATPAAKRFYVSSSAAWQSYWARLMQFEEQGIRVIGRAEVLRVRPAQIALYKRGGGRVDLRVCSSSEGVRVLQDGKPLPQASASPKITLVQMVRLEGEAQWRLLSDRVGPPC